jgi:hypothetical protein
VAFQLQQETRQVFAEHARTFALDYEMDPDAPEAASTSVRYLVGACPQVCADSWLAVAQAGGLSLAALEPRRDALARVSQPHLTQRMAQASLTLVLHCEAALGLALAGWGQVSYNFLRHRPLGFIALCRAGWIGIGVCAMGGAMLAAGFALVMTASVHAMQHRLQQGQPAARVLAQAREKHERAQAAQKLQAQQDQWLHKRQTAQAQSLAWTEALTQASQGIWISHIQQRGEHWWLEGEALSSQHAQRLLGHLKALDIWVKAPELPHLQLGTSAVAGQTTTSRSSVWIFRIEAELKADD